MTTSNNIKYAPNSWLNMLSFLDSYWEEENKIKNSIATSEQTNRINTSLNFYWQSQEDKTWLKPETAVEVRNKQHNASRAAKLTSMIVQYWADNWITVTWKDSDIINQYISNLSPDVRKHVAERFYDYTHSTEYAENSKDFALEMWWRHQTTWEKIWDWIKDFWSYLWYWPDKLSRWIRKLEDKGNAYLDPKNNKESLDVMNLANERYWFWALADWYLSDEQWDDLQFEIDNNATSLEKQHSLSNIALDIWIWTVMTAVNFMGRGVTKLALPKWFVINSVIWLASQLPYSKDVLEFANETSWDLWYYINSYIPWLSQYRKSLKTEESKREFDEFTGNMIVWLMFGIVYKYARWNNGKQWKTTWWKWWGGTLQPINREQAMEIWIKNFIDNTPPEEIVKTFEETKKTTQELSKEWQLQLIDKEFWPFENSEEWLRDRESLRRWNQLFEWEEFKTYEEKNTRTNELIKDLVNKEDKLLSQDKKLYGKKDILEATKDKSNPKWFDFLSRIFENIEKAYEYMQDDLWSEQREWFREMKKKYDSNSITRKEINDVLRKTNGVIEMYKKKYNWTATPDNWKFETQTRSFWNKWKEFVWKWLDDFLPWNENVFKTLEQNISDLYTMDRYTQKKSVEVMNSKWNEYYQWEARADYNSKLKKWWANIRKIFKPSLRETATNIMDRWARIKDYNIQWVEDLLPEMDRDFATLSKELWETWKLKKIEADINNLKDTAIELKKAEESLNNLKNDTKIDKVIDTKIDLLEDSTKLVDEESILKNKENQEILDNQIKNFERLKEQYTSRFIELLEDLWVPEKEISDVSPEIIQKSLFDE